MRERGRGFNELAACFYTPTERDTSAAQSTHHFSVRRRAGRIYPSFIRGQADKPLSVRR